MSILVRREQEKYFFRLKTAVNYGTIKRQVGAEVSGFEVSSLEGFFFRSQQLAYKIVYTCMSGFMKTVLKSATPITLISPRFL